MNGLIPTLLAVLFAEIGGRATTIANTRRIGLFGAIVGGLVAAAAVGGDLIAPTMTPRAQTLLVALALLLAGFGQVRPVRTRDGFLPILLMVWSGGSPLVIFATGARFGPVTAVIGGLLGLVAAIALTLGAQAVGLRTILLQRIAATLLIGAGTIAGLFALQSS